MMSNKLVGYKIKRTLKAGDVVSSTDGIYEAIYEPKTPLEELSDMAYGYAHFRKDPDLDDKIEELVKQIEASL
jgi:hypothetical protein